MTYLKFIIILPVIIASCQTIKKEENIVFNKVQWQQKYKSEYVNRRSMLHDIVYNDTIRNLSMNEITNLLGKPDKIYNNHFYYLIDKKKLSIWTLHNTNMVIKFSKNDSIEWIKIHE